MDFIGKSAIFFLNLQVAIGYDTQFTVPLLSLLSLLHTEKERYKLNPKFFLSKKCHLLKNYGYGQIT